MPKVTVYVPAESWRSLQAEGHEPAGWVRDMVKQLLEKKAAAKEDK